MAEKSNKVLAREIESLRKRIERSEKKTKDLKGLVKTLQAVLEES